MRKNGYKNDEIEINYHKSFNMYGLDDKFDAVPNEGIGLTLSTVGLNIVFAVYNDMLKHAMKGQRLNENGYKMFEHYGVKLEKSFIKGYLKSKLAFEKRYE